MRYFALILLLLITGIGVFLSYNKELFQSSKSCEGFCYTVTLHLADQLDYTFKYHSRRHFESPYELLEECNVIYGTKKQRKVCIEYEDRRVEIPMEHVLYIDMSTEEVSTVAINEEQNTQQEDTSCQS